MKRILILFFLLANLATMAQRRIGIQDYSTVAALQAETINPSQNDKVYVKALQAVFAWDAASTATHDGVTVIKQTNITTGRFLLVGTSAYQLSGKLDATDTTALLRKTTAAATYQPKGNYGLLGSNNVWSGNNSLSKAIFPQNASWESYNTLDQTTNFSRIGGKWSADTYEIITERAGSNVTDTHIAIGAAIGGINRLTVRANSTPAIFTFNSGSFGGAGFATMTTSLGSGNPIVQNVLSLYPTISQSASAGYRGLFVSPFEQTTGSGAKLPLDVGTNSAANGGGTHTSRFSVASNGEVNFGTLGRMFSDGNWFLGSSAVNDGNKLIVAGSARVQGALVAQALNITTGAGAIIGGGAINPSAVLEAVSTTKGFLPPRMTQTQRNAITSPATGLVVYCTDCTGGKLQAYNGSTWDSMGTSTWSSITGNILSNTDLKKALSDGFVLPEHFGAVADGTTDDVLAIQLAINYARDNGLVLRLSPVSYRITNTLVNQYDGNYKSLKVIGQGSTILCDTKGKKALNLTGGYALTEISNLTLKYTGTNTNADTTTNGLVATNVRCYLENVKVDGFLCDGFQFISTSPNMNSSYWEKLRADNNKRYGFYITGTDDNISVTKGSLYCENNGYSGIYVTDDCMIRDAEFFVYAENNCQLNQSKAGVYLGKIRNSRLTVYSEQTNSAEEIRLGANCTDNQLFSFRNNKDYFGGSNTGYRGNRIYQQDGSRASTPIVLRADYARAGIDGEYVKMDLQGVNINYGSLKGENDGIYLTNSTNKIGVTSDRVKISSTQPIITNGAFYINGDGSSVANYINGDLAFRQVSGNNVYLDLSTANGTHGGFKIRSSNTYTTRFEVKPEGQINLSPLSSPPASQVAGDMWYNSNTGKFQAHEGGTKNILTSYSSGIGGVTLASGVATVTITGLQATDKAFVQLVSTSGTLGTHYKAVCTANTLTITSVNTSGTTVTTDNSTLSYTVIR